MRAGYYEMVKESMSRDMVEGDRMFSDSACKFVHSFLLSRAKRKW